jgi:serine/threonine protein kinase
MLLNTNPISQRFGPVQKSFYYEVVVDIFSQLLETVCYLHQQNVMHRDLKPDNILLAYENYRFNIKIIDFGFSIKQKTDTRGLGTVGYIAPEIYLNKKYDQKVDMWSAGSILYQMLTGFQPFIQDEEDF